MIFRLLEAVLLGIVQGVTEPLPISSTAHLALIEHLFNLDKQTYGLTFDMFINIGTTSAVITYFWKDLKKLFAALRLPTRQKPLSPDERLPWQLIAVTVPVGLVGLALEKKIETDLRNLLPIAVGLAVIGLFMLWADRGASLVKKTDKKPATGKQIWGMGLSQILALAPGVSRSGITVATGLSLGMDRVDAAEYSFLLSVPITVAAVLKKLYDFLKLLAHHQVPHDVLAFYVVGAIASWVTAYFTLRFLLGYYSRSRLSTFAYYRLGLAALLVLLVLIGK